MDELELEGAAQFGRSRDLALALGTALQGLDPDRGRLEADVGGSNGQGLRDPGAGVCESEGESLVLGPRRQSCGFEEAPAITGGELFAAAGSDEPEIAGQPRHFARRSVRPGLSATPSLDLPGPGILRDRAQRGGPRRTRNERVRVFRLGLIYITSACPKTDKSYTDQ